jgi:hypothetical protein
MKLPILFALHYSSPNTPKSGALPKSILAISIAPPALHGVVQISEGVIGVSGCSEFASRSGWIIDGGGREEEERRYNTMKKSSLIRQTVKRTLSYRLSSST